MDRFAQYQSRLSAFDQSLGAALDCAKTAVEAGKNIIQAIGVVEAAMEQGPPVLRYLEQTHTALKGVRGPQARKLGFSRQRMLELQADIRRVKASCKVWRHMRQILEQIQTPDRISLYARRDRIAEAKARPMDQLVLALDSAINPAPQDKDSKNRGHYSDIRLPISDFQDHMSAAARLLLMTNAPRPWRFLDVGCGGGVKVLAAMSYVDEAVGLEYDRGYFAAASRLAENWPDRMAIRHGDALAFDDYGEFDIIYAYKPIADAALMTRLEARIAAKAKPGAVIVLPYLDVLYRMEETGLTQIIGSIFVTGAGASDVDALVQRAECCGLDSPLSAKAVPERLIQWAGLIEACRMHGHDALMTM